MRLYDRIQEVLIALTPTKMYLFAYLILEKESGKPTMLGDILVKTKKMPAMSEIKKQILQKSELDLSQFMVMIISFNRLP